MRKVVSSDFDPSPSHAVRAPVIIHVTLDMHEERHRSSAASDDALVLLADLIVVDADRLAVATLPFEASLVSPVRRRLGELGDDQVSRLELLDDLSLAAVDRPGEKV